MCPSASASLHPWHQPCTIALFSWRFTLERGMQNHTHPSIHTKAALDHSGALLTSNSVVRDTAQNGLSETAS